MPPRSGTDRWYRLSARAHVVPLPRALSMVIGGGCVVVGAVLTLRPFTSLSVLVVLIAAAALAAGVGELLRAEESTTPWSSRAVGIAWVALGILVVIWPGMTIAALTVWVGLGLIVSGVLRTIGGVRGTADQRVTASIGGVAGVLFGVLALAWPDVTVLVIAVLFGIRTVLYGSSLIADGLRRRTGVAAAPPGRTRLRRWGRSVSAVVGLVAVLLLALVSVLVHRASPSPTAFYTTPASVPSRPGVLLRSEPFTKKVPTGARAWRILYTTTRDDGIPAVASGLVVASTELPAGPRPVIAWAHGTTGYARRCAPSLLADPFGAGALPALGEVIARGWILVATDYVGLGTEGPHPYLIGQGPARSVLDAVRAAKQLSGLRLADRTVVWGHSQGGNAALWTGMIAPTYAPDVHVIGIAALAPASDLIGLIDNSRSAPGGAIFASYVIAAYSAIYPDVRFNDNVRPAASIIVRANATRCLAEPEVFVSAGTSAVANQPIFSGDPARGALGERLRQNAPSGVIESPVLVAQGETDGLIPATVQSAYVAQRCALGGSLDYRIYPGRGHVDIVAADSPLVPDLLTWTQDRIRNRPAPASCP